MLYEKKLKKKIEKKIKKIKQKHETAYLHTENEMQVRKK